MASYSYVAVTASGATESGDVVAPSTEEAYAILAERQLTPVSLQERRTPEASREVRRKVRNTDIVALMRELATLATSGVTMAETLVTLRDANVNTPLFGPLASMVTSIHAGAKVSKALEECGVSFPEYAHALVQAGEETGNMGFALEKCADQMEFDARMNDQAKEAMVYPSILVLTGIFAVIFIFSFVVPRFTLLLKGRSDTLPFISKLVLGAGTVVSGHFTLVICSLVVVGLLVFWALKQPFFRTGALRLAQNTPVLREWIHSGETARWTSILAVLLKSKVPVLNALELAARSVRVSSYAHRLLSVRDDLNRGKRFAQAVEARQLLEPTSMSMVKVGEQTGEMAVMLEHVSHYWVERNRSIQRRLVALVEPIAILLIAGIIGVVMVGVVLAMASLTEVKL